MKRVLIAGGSGFVGEHLRRHFLALYYEVYILTTNKRLAIEENYIYWQPSTNVFHPKGIIDFDVLVNLAGANIGEKYWTKARKKELVKSRVDSTNFIQELISNRQLKIDFLVQGSAIGIYGDRGAETLFESSSEGDGFMAFIVKKWEEAARKFEVPYSILRIGIVFHDENGAFKKLIQGLKFRICILFGNGQHYHSWIEIDDLCRMILFVSEKKLVGIYNAVCPQPVQNIYLLKRFLNKFEGRSIPIVIPKFILKFVFRDFSELILNSQRVSAAKICSTGFIFNIDSLSKFFQKYKKSWR